MQIVRWLLIALSVGRGVVLMPNHRPDAQLWITSYASIFHRPGVPLIDLCRIGRAGDDPRMLFSW